MRRLFGDRDGSSLDNNNVRVEAESEVLYFVIEHVYNLSTPLSQEPAEELQRSFNPACNFLLRSECSTGIVHHMRPHCVVPFPRI